MPFSPAANPDRPPPHNLEAEHSVLGSCLIDNDQIDEVSRWISPPDFYRDANGEVFRAILEIRDAGKGADAVTLADHLIARGRFEALGGDEMLRQICDVVPHAANAVYYARIVREKSIARQILESAEQTLREVYGNEHTAQDLIERAESRIFAITDRAATGETIDADTLVGETWGRLQTLKERRVIGISTGFGDIDGTIGGLVPGQFAILAARPSMGKTALGLNIASNVAADGKGVLFASLEMSRAELGNRLFAAHADVAGDSLLRPWFLGEEDWRKILDACGRISQFPLFIDDTPVRTTFQIAANARRIKHRSPCGLALIVVDYLGLIKGQKDKGESRQEEVAGVSRRLKAMAREIKVPVLCLHQLNRGVEHRDDRRPRMADLRESGQIEQDADLVLLLHRPEVYKADDRPGEADLIVAKNRNGQTGAVKLRFSGPLTRFDSLAADHPPF